MKNAVIITYSGSGWFTFSPSGHQSYNRGDEIKVRGTKKIVKTMQELNVRAKQLINSELLSHEKQSLIFKK